MLYSTTKVPLKRQGADFILDEKVKCQKLITPKGLIKEAIWQTLLRSLDNFCLIYNSAADKLGLLNDEKERLIDLSKEIITLGAVLHSSKYLSNANYNNLPENILKEILSEDMANFSARVKEKRECIWKLIEEQALIVNVKREVMPGKRVDPPWSSLCTGSGQRIWSVVLHFNICLTFLI